MKKITLLFITFLFFFSCKTTEIALKTTTTNEIEAVEPEIVNTEPLTMIIEVPSEGIKVSEELYTSTFESIQELITEVTQLIRRKNYNGWKKYLSQHYINKVGGADYLNELSQLPLMQEKGQLRNLKDYFLKVVVPSRINSRLDEIVFRDEQHVTAYMILEEQRTILFQFELIDTQWTITIWE